MKMYRLKKEAVEFFQEKHATAIYSADTWDSLQVDAIALEEVKNPYLKYGIKQSENSSTLGGWDKEGSSFEFTIVFPSTEFHEHDKFSNGKLTRELMNKIQQQINYWYIEFANKK
jgi:hypothetical protein